MTRNGRKGKAENETQNPSGVEDLRKGFVFSALLVFRT
jgi:hypothetical protein